MRSIALFALPSLLAACGGYSMHLEYQSQLESDVTSMTLLDNATGHASMRDTTCLFDVVNGFVISDTDLPSEAELVRDNVGQLVLASSEHGLHYIHLGEWDPYSDVPMQGVLDAAFTAEGTLAVVDDGSCGVIWVERGVRVEIPSCEAPNLVGNAGGVEAWVLDSGVVYQVSQDGITEVMDAERIAFDDVSGTLYAASGSVLGAADTDGAVHFVADLGGDIESLSTLGGVGAILVNDKAHFIAVGSDGEILTDTSIPEGAKAIGSENGRDLSLVTEGGDAFFYRLEEGGEGVTYASNTQVENPFQD